MEEYYIGQIFSGDYPEEASKWCEGNNATIEEATPEGAEFRQFAIVANPPKPETRTVRTFSKFSIWVATRDLPVEEGSTQTVWEAFETFLHDQGLWSGWNQLVDLVEDNPFFESFYPIACEALGKELVDQVLAASVSSVQQKVITDTNGGE
jgi:hypothetical protein